jgi:D-alanyl-D-alanine carboxypeptidase
VSVSGGTGPWSGPERGTVRVTHTSNSLAPILKRFNTYSNNDIERLEASIGSAEVLAANLAARWNGLDGSLHFDTLSGLGTNRITPRLTVRLVRELARTCSRLELGLEDVLPLAGCGASTLSHLPGLRHSAASRALVAKTGTLVNTDGGVSVLAGVARTGQGERLFCVAAPRAGRLIWAARQNQTDFVLELMKRYGGPARRTCPAPPGLSDADASAEIVAPAEDPTGLTTAISVIGASAR